MKKNGFTLAEVLITLAIIGVVAAVTLPSLTRSTTNAQVGPKLMKAISSIEQANYAMLAENGIDRLSFMNFSADDTYEDELSNHLRITKRNVSNETWWKSQDGIAYNFSAMNGTGLTPVTIHSDRPHKQPMSSNGTADKVAEFAIVVDLDGPDTGRGETGVDQFHFVLYNDGSLRPVGGADWLVGDNSTADGGTNHWSKTCNSTSTTNSMHCAGSIVENGGKVIYGKVKSDGNGNNTSDNGTK